MTFSNRSSRTLINYPADIISGGYRFGGIIANLSREGIGIYIINPSDTNTLQCAPEKNISLEFQLPSGEQICIAGTVKWLRSNKTVNHTMNSIGIILSAPPRSYIQFLNSLNETLNFVWKETAMT